MTFKALTASLALFMCACASHADILAVTYTGEVYDIEATTGNKHLIRDNAVTGVNSLAGLFSTYYACFDSKLYTVNKNTGVFTFFTNLNFTDAADVRAMAFDSAGQLWLVTNHPQGDRLYKFNLQTNTETFIGNTGCVGIQAMDFDADDELYVWDSGGGTSDALGLAVLSRVDGHAIDVNAAEGSADTMQSIAFNSSGQLFGISDTLYRISPTSGSVRSLASGYGDVRGIEFETSGSRVVPVNSAIVRLGKVGGGNVSSLKGIDGNQLTVCRFVVPNSSTPPVQVDLDGVSPFNALDLYQFELTHNTVDAGAFQVELQAMNFTLNRFDSMVTSTIGTVQKKTSFTAANPDAYVSPSKVIRVKYLIKPVGPTAVLQWCHQVDRAQWKLEPFIG